MASDKEGKIVGFGDLVGFVRMEGSLLNPGSQDQKGSDGHDAGDDDVQPAVYTGRSRNRSVTRRSVHSGAPLSVVLAKANPNHATLEGTAP